MLSWPGHSFFHVREMVFSRFSGWNFLFFFYGFSWFFIAPRQLKFGYSNRMFFWQTQSLCGSFNVSRRFCFWSSCSRKQTLSLATYKLKVVRHCYKITVCMTQWLTILHRIFWKLQCLDISTLLSTMALGLMMQGAPICMTAARDKLVERFHLWKFK